METATTRLSGASGTARKQHRDGQSQAAWRQGSRTLLTLWSVGRPVRMASHALLGRPRFVE
jgi:hypothetical protein